jgi:hypothetical protein
MSTSGPEQRNELSCYVNTLADPWQHGPCRIGFGTLVPTQLATAFLRTTLVSNADGTLAVAIIPQLVNMLFYNASGLAGISWSSANASNATAIQASMTEGRVVSGGIRAFPQIPGTSAPGVIYAMMAPSVNTNFLGTTSPTSLLASPQCKLGYAAAGGSAVILPIDPVSFQFNVGAISGFAGNANLPTSVAILVMTGLPASSNVLIEASLNIEGIMSTASTGAITTPGQDVAEYKTLADYFPSLDRLWSTVKRMVPEPATVNAGFATAARISRVYNDYSRAIASGARKCSRRTRRGGRESRSSGEGNTVPGEHGRFRLLQRSLG